MPSENQQNAKTLIDRPIALVLTFIAVLLVVTYSIYLPGMSGPLLLDDIPQLRGMIENSADDPQSLIENHLVSTSGPLGRAVSMASFIGSAMTHGPDTWWWKHENVLLHLISGLLVFWLAALLFESETTQRFARPWMAGSVAAAIWMLHPLQISTVLYTVQRMTELSSLFVFAGLISYAKGRQRQIHMSANGWPHLFIGFAVFLPLAILGKESALLFPVYCGLMEFFVFRFQGSQSTQRIVKYVNSAFAIGFIIVAIYFLARFSDLVLKAYEIRDFTFWERVLTQFRIVATYLSQILVPVQNKMGFFHDDILVSTSLFSPITTLLSALFLAALIASAVYFRKRLPLYAFGVLFFFAGHALESTIFALELMYEHRNYLPSFGICIALVAMAQVLVKKQNVLTLITIIGLSGLSLITWQRAITWGSANTLYPYMYGVHPESQRLNLIFTESHARMGNYDEARITLSKMYTSIATDTHKLFLDCLEHGDVSEREISGLLNQSDGWLDGRVAANIDDLSRAILANRCRVPSAAFIALIDHTLSLRSRWVGNEQKVLYAKARLLESAGQIDAAVDALGAAYDTQPDNSMPLYFSAHTLSIAGRLDEAATFLSSAFEVEKSSRIHHKDIAKSIYLNVGRFYSEQSRFEESLAVFSEGTMLMPGEPLILIDTADLLIRLERHDEARQVLSRLRSLDSKSTREYLFIIERLEAASTG